jgi:phosphoglycolate phosphatase-like HAD superfamily hydrolase
MRLVLFDIDGTILTADGAPRRAFHRAMLEVYGTAGPIGAHRFDGKTDPQIARELLRLAGLPDSAIDRGLEALWAAYLRELSTEFAQPTHITTVLPGVRPLLDRLEQMEEVVLGLLTGNIAPGAALKLSSAGIRNRFPIGAFGSDCEQRSGLPPVAVARALELTGRSFTRTDIVIIGDTPSDVTCGSALGVRAIGVATGRHRTQELVAAGAAHAFEDLRETARVVDVIMAA